MWLECTSFLSLTSVLILMLTPSFQLPLPHFSVILYLIQCFQKYLSCSHSPLILVMHFSIYDWIIKISSNCFSIPCMFPGAVVMTTSVLFTKNTAKNIFSSTNTTRHRNDILCEKQWKSQTKSVLTRDVCISCDIFYVVSIVECLITSYNIIISSHH